MRILFVCLGNICRSPMAEALLRHKAALMGVDVEVDSAGTGDWHVGASADPRTLATLERNGIAAPSVARQLRSEDFIEFDEILVMDRANLKTVLSWHGAIPEKVRLIDDPEEVADPYYDLAEGFDLTYAQLERAADRLVERFNATAG